MFRLRTFGGAALFDDGRPLDGPAVQRRRIALLALLAMAGESGMSRDKLLALLWPETETERARHTLSQWLHLLRRDLRAADVVQGNADLRLNDERFASDVRDFERATASGNLDAAFELYAGPFLDGFHLTDSPEFERWLDAQRERLAATWRRAAETLAARRTASGDHAGAAAVCRRLAAAEPFEMRYALGVMRAYAATGDIPAALTHARVHAQLLEQEFGEQMPPEIRALANQLETQQRKARDAALASAPRNVAPGELAATVPEEVPAMIPSGSQPPAARLRLSRSRRVMLLAVPVAIVLLLVIAAFIPRQLRSTMLTVLSRHSNPLNRRLIVVAPLTNATGDTSLSAFGDMAAFVTAQALTRTGELEVADAQSAILTSRIVDMLPRVLRSSNRAVALAEELGAGQAIEGRFYMDGDSLKAQAQLLDVATGLVRERVGPISGTRGQLEAIAQALGERFAPVAAAQADSSFSGVGIALSAPPSYETYRETSSAWASYYRGDLPALEMHVARARASDSTYMLPLVILGHVYSEQRDWRGVDSLARILSAHRAQVTPLERAGSELLEALARGDADAILATGLELAHAAPASAETRTHAAHLAVEANRPRDALQILAGVNPTRGVLLIVPWYWSWKCAALHELGDYQGQVEVVKQGLHQFPDDDALLLHLGRALGALGREREVLELMDRAPIVARKSALHLAVLQRDAMALEWSRELAAHGHPREAAHLAGIVADWLARTPIDTAIRAVRLRAMAMEQAQRWPEARALFSNLLARDRRDVSTRGHLAVSDLHLGLRAEADRIDQELAATPGDYLHGLATIWRARIAATRGDRDESVRLMARAVEEGYMRGYDLYGSSFGEFDLHTDPFLEPVRALPAARRLLAARG